MHELSVNREEPSRNFVAKKRNHAGASLVSRERNHAGASWQKRGTMQELSVKTKEPCELSVNREES
jgi:hypothetical protein